MTLAYQWSRRGVAITGASAQTYVVQPADVGATLTVTVSGSKPGYTAASKTSAQTDTVPAPKALTATPVPTISGSAKVGAKLTAKPGAWAPVPVTLSYQWMRNGSPIGGATGSTYLVTASDRGTTLTVTVTGSKANYAPVSKTAKPTKTVVAGSITPATPSIKGSAKVGAKVTAAAGTWNPSGLDLKYQWYRSGKVIKSATQPSYTLQPADKGKKLTVKVTGSKDGYTTKAMTSRARKVAAGTLESVTPRIVGEAKVGKALTLEMASWGPAPISLKYRWYRSGRAISKATKTTYTLNAADVGKRITLKVTGSKAGYTTVTKASKATTKVARGTLVAGIPKISGNPLVGAKLTVTAGDWGPAPVTIKYQWYRSGRAITKATRTSYTLLAADLGSTISVRVSGTKAGYDTKSVTAAATAVIQ